MTFFTRIGMAIDRWLTPQFVERAMRRRPVQYCPPRAFGELAKKASSISPEQRAENAKRKALLMRRIEDRPYVPPPPDNRTLMDTEWAAHATQPGDSNVATSANFASAQQQSVALSSWGAMP